MSSQSLGSSSGETVMTFPFGQGWSVAAIVLCLGSTLLADVPKQTNDKVSFALSGMRHNVERLRSGIYSARGHVKENERGTSRSREVEFWSAFDYESGCVRIDRTDREQPRADDENAPAAEPKEMTFRFANTPKHSLRWFTGRSNASVHPPVTDYRQLDSAFRPILDVRALGFVYKENLSTPFEDAITFLAPEVIDESALETPDVVRLTRIFPDDGLKYAGMSRSAWNCGGVRSGRRAAKSRGPSRNGERDELDPDGRCVAAPGVSAGRPHAEIESHDLVSRIRMGISQSLNRSRDVLLERDGAPARIPGARLPVAEGATGHCGDHRPRKDHADRTGPAGCESAGSLAGRRRDCLAGCDHPAGPAASTLMVSDFVPPWS